MELHKKLEFEYVNYKGEKGRRRVLPIRIRYDKTPNTEKPYWILIAYDLDKNCERHFVIEHIQQFYEG